MSVSKASLPPLPPGIDLGLITAHLMSEGYVIQKPAKSTGNPAAPAAPVAPVAPDTPATPTDVHEAELAALRSRYARDPDRADIRIRWCKEPDSGSPGRAEYKVDKLLCMTRKGFLFCRKEIKSLLIRDPVINMDLAITKNDPDAVTRVCHQAARRIPEFEDFRRQRFWPIRAIILLILKNTSETFNSNKRALEDEAAAARGEVIVRKKKAKAATTAKGRAKAKELKVAKQAGASDATNRSSASNGRTVSKANQVAAPGAGNAHSTTDAGDHGSGADPGEMEISFRAEVPPITPEEADEDRVANVTHELSSMQIDPGEDKDKDEDEDEPFAVKGSFLAGLDLQATSTPLPTRTPKQPSAQLQTQHEPDLTTTTFTRTGPSTLASTTATLPPTLQSTGPTLVDTVASAGHSTNAATTIHPEPIYPPVDASKSLPTPPPSQSVTEGAGSSNGAHTTTTRSLAPPAASLADQLARLNALAATLGPAQLALLPPDFFQTFLSSVPSELGSVPTSNPASNPTVNNTIFGEGSDSDLSDVESASESNPPIASKGSDTASTRPKTKNDTKNKKDPKGAAAAKVVLPGTDVGEAGSAGAKFAQALRSAKDTKTAKGVPTEDQDGNQDGEELVVVSTKKTRAKSKPVAVTAAAEDQPPDQQGNPVSALHSGLYITLNHNAQSTGPSRAAYIVYWPEIETWDDQQSAETVSNTLRRNRETFMRFLTRLCEQTIALVSSSQAEKFVWGSAVQSGVPENRQSNDARSRMEEFHVFELDEQEDDVIASPGFEVPVDQFMRKIQNSDHPASEMRLVEGEERIGLLTCNTEGGRFKDKPFEGRISKTELRRLIESQKPYNITIGSISSKSLKVLASNGLKEKYPKFFEDYGKSREDARNNWQIFEVIEKAKIESMSDQDKVQLEEEIRDMVCREYNSTYSTSSFSPPTPLAHGAEKHALLHHIYGSGLSQVRKDIQKHLEYEPDDQEFQSLKMRWIPLRDRLEGNRQAPEESLIRWVNEVIDGAPGSSDEGRWLTKVWNTVKIGRSANSRTLSDTEFVAQILQRERDYPCLAPLVRITLDILRKELEELAKGLILTHLDAIVSPERQSQLRALEEECNRTLREEEIKLTNSLIQSLQKAMVPSLSTAPTLHLDSISQEYQYTGFESQRPTSWLLWKGTTRDYLPPRSCYNIYPFEFTTQDRHQSELDEGHVPTPKAASTERFSFAIPTEKSIDFIRLVQNKCLLAISDATEGYLRFYVADNVSMASELQKEGLSPLRYDRLGGSQCVYGFDQTTRLLAIVHGSEDPSLSLLRFDQRFTQLQRYRPPISLSAWYKHRPEIASVCFQAGRPEIFLIESSGSVQLVSISAEMIRPAPFQIEPPIMNAFSSPDGSCLLAVVGGAASSEPHSLLAFHWDSSGLVDQVEGVKATDLPSTATPPVATRFYGKGRIHVVSFLPADNTIKSTTLQIKQKTTEFAIRSENEALPTAGIQTVNNSLVDCHLEVWTRFPVVPTITRITPVPVSRKQRQLVFVSPLALPQAPTYFERMISTLRKTTHKPIDRALTTTIVSSTQGIGCELFESVSEFKLGSFIVELICLIPIHIAATMDNKFMPLKDGVWDPDYESSLAGLTIEEINESLSFGWYESIFQSYMADKLVRVVSSMGEQSVGKSYCLNHFADTSFAGSAMRTTEGAWLSCTPTEDYLLVSLDFEGLQSTERSPQEDMLLVLFNTAISNLILFRNNFAVSRNVRGLFTSFELSAGTLDPVKNPGLFQSTLAIIIKDVTDGDTSGIKAEFRLKFGEIVKTERNRNFISRLHRGKILITPWPVINSPEFYSLFESIQDRLEAQDFTHQTGGGFLHKVKTLMVNIKTGNWDSIEQGLASSRAHQLKKRLKMALSHGGTLEGPLKNMNTDQEIATSEDEPIFYVPDAQGEDSFSAQDQISADQAELKKQQRQAIEERLEILISRCEPLSTSRQRGPGLDLIYFEALQKSLHDTLERRFNLVELWINVNSNHLPPENVELRELNRIFDSLKRDMKAAVQLCQSLCTSCELHCMGAQSHSESGDHDCSTDHQCQSHCEVLEDHLKPPLCGLKAGHIGKHMCALNAHSCGQPCDLKEWAGCTQACTKPLDHGGDEHLCSASSHICGKPCELRSIPHGLNQTFDCSGNCQKPWNEEHDRHECDTSTCPIQCALCPHPSPCCSADHFHGLEPNATHLCRADHPCSENCEADGICHVDFVPSEKTFIGKHANYKYTRHEQAPKRLPCKVRIPQGQLTHFGLHNHDPENNSHKCDARCPGCKYFCTHPMNHSQKLHATVHGSMTGSLWIVDSEDTDQYKLEDHHYASGDSGESMYCHMLCVKQGRHAHIDFCRDPSDHSRPLREHISRRLEPEPHREKDWISHAEYWERTGFEDPYGNANRIEFAKCDARCADPAHGDPSECILPIFHLPKSQHPSPSSGYISQDGHQFACANPAQARQAYHIVFVVDNSGSMRCRDIKPEPTPIRSRLVSEGCDDRYGAVVSALFSFWKTREGTRVGSSSVIREDHYSVVVFDDEAEARVEDDYRLTTDQLVDKLIPQKSVGMGWTNFEAGIEVAQEVIENNWNSQRAPIIVFLSDGGGSIPEIAMRNVCNLCVKLGQALAFYAISFGPDSDSNALQFMVSIAEQVFRGAPPSTKDAYLGQEPPCKNFANTMTSIQLSNTFVKISNSLPKLRASVINKAGASGRY